jgi:hypothetical protein
VFLGWKADRWANQRYRARLALSRRAGIGQYRAADMCGASCSAGPFSAARGSGHQAHQTSRPSAGVVAGAKQPIKIGDRSLKPGAQFGAASRRELYLLLRRASQPAGWKQPVRVPDGSVAPFHLAPIRAPTRRPNRLRADAPHLDTPKLSTGRSRCCVAITTHIVNRLLQIYSRYPSHHFAINHPKTKP